MPRASTSPTSSSINRDSLPPIVTKAMDEVANRNGTIAKAVTQPGLTTNSDFSGLANSQKSSDVVHAAFAEWLGVF